MFYIKNKIFQLKYKIKEFGEWVYWKFVEERRVNKTFSKIKDKRSKYDQIIRSLVGKGFSKRDNPLYEYRLIKNIAFRMRK